MLKIKAICYAHDDVIKWKHFPCYWPSLVNSLHKGQWRGALLFSLICTRINGWVNNGEAGDLRRHWAHYDVIVMQTCENWLGLVSSCIYYAHQTCEIYQVVPYSVNFKATWELWNPLSITVPVLSIWNKGPVMTVKQKKYPVSGTS